MKKKLTFKINKNIHFRIDKAIFESLPTDLKLSRSRLQVLIRRGLVFNASDMSTVTLRTKVSDVSKVTVSYGSFYSDKLESQNLSLEIVYEDEFLAVINKPANMSVHPINFEQRDTLVNGLIHLYGSQLADTGCNLRPGIVHRLDKDTTGLILIAKTDEIATNLMEQFKSRKVKKVYLAFCHGNPFESLEKLIAKEGVSVSKKGGIDIVTNLGRDRKNRELMSVKADVGKKAISQFKLLKVFDLENNRKVSLIQCNIETGRTHQIRVHLSYLGHSILGDKLYGNSNIYVPNPSQVSKYPLLSHVKNFPRQALHAKELSFFHPVSFEKKTFFSMLSEDLIDLQERLSSKETIN